MKIIFNILFWSVGAFITYTVILAIFDYIKKRRLDQEDWDRDYLIE